MKENDKKRFELQLWRMATAWELTLAFLTTLLTGQLFYESAENTLD